MDIWEIFNLKIKKIFEIGPILPWFCPWIYEKVFTSLLRIKKFQKNSRFSLCFVHGYIERSFEKYPLSVMYKQAGFHYHDKEDFMNNKLLLKFSVIRIRLLLWTAMLIRLWNINRIWWIGSENCYNPKKSCSPNSIISEHNKKENTWNIYVKNNPYKGFMSIIVKSLLFFHKSAKI